MKINRIHLLKRGLIPCLFILVLSFLPDDFFQMFSLYSVDTYDFIAYKVVKYHFPLIQLLVILVSFLYLRRNIKYFLIPIVIVVTEIIRFLFGKDNIFSLSSYEGLLPIVVAVAFFIIVENYFREIERYELFFNFFCILNIISQFFLLILGSGIPGRYNAVNLGVEPTGMLAAIYFLYLLKTKKMIKHRKMLLILSFISLILSGSRIALLLLIIVLLFNYAIFVFKNKGKIKMKSYMLILFIVIFLCICLVFTKQITLPFIDADRILKMFSMTSLHADESGLGRLESIVLGVDILRDNIFGTSFSLINLQYLEYLRGFQTFPHSSVLCCLIMIGPIFYLFLTMVLCKIIKLFKCGNSITIVLIYLLLFVTLTGGIITNFKVYLIMLLTYHLVCSQQSENSIQMIEQMTK